ncbi:HD domain-containing phosphohydrolase [Paraglaciecola sp. 2405UD69-4]|uniref:HD domain-containing phosphohydrolase n=1 Tax=Paraglaciecola sp. 2405UD69-4 TaxID=3391836 RepID=UPI0039C95BE2
MNKENSLDTPPMTVLCVDDELNILKSMKRLLYKQNYQLLLAENGEKALQIIEKQKIHLIVSDMKMPGMSGAALLGKVSTLSPDTYRILLTGYSDMESTIEAINKGKIHRYLQKPWENQEIIDAIEEGLSNVKLKNENTRLQKLIKFQNAKLKELNQNLESKIQLKTKQIQLALKRNENNNQATQKVLYNLISINPNLSGSFANSVSVLAKNLAEKLELPKLEVANITFAALLCEIGLLGLDTAIYCKPFDELNFNQKQEYIDQTKTAQLILGPATHLQEVSDIITCQFENFNGSGPNQLFDSQIPIGAKILSVARDFWRYSLGRINSEKLDETEVRLTMKKFLGTRYDPKVLEILLNTPDIVSDEFIEKPIPSHALKAGMTLKCNIFNDAHILVLPEGHVFTNKTISKLLQFEKSQAAPLSLIVEDCPPVTPENGPETTS